MSKKARGTTKDANSRRERHARKVWGKAELPKAARWFSQRLRRKRRDELARQSLAKLRREIAALDVSKVLGRDVVLKFNGEKIQTVPASVLDWHAGPGVS